MVLSKQNKVYLDRMVRDYAYYKESGSEAPIYLSLLNHMAIDLQGAEDITPEILTSFARKIKEIEKEK